MFIFKGFIVVLFLIFMLPLAQASLQEIAYFENCSGYNFFVGISSLGPLYEESYELLGCKFLSETETGHHNWFCSCEEDLNLTIETMSLLDTTFSVSVLRVAEDLNYDFVQTYNNKNISVKVLSINPIEKNNELNGARSLFVFSTKIILLAGVLSLMFLVFVLFIVFDFLGGLPWTSKRERALNLHRKGQRAFGESKLKKAKRYYSRASKLRK